ncbi:hypothetical protein H310_05157 [Aphanomyces invadans]|uniref:Retrotransposon gag domain-containing protein n=1 Tax=Aphanomyces invadans TaxID=157072 RepID=A0A024UBL4_9STRA|nr:hypothetical protein H310_05157 [Aphanomyces invadans]ETW03791.1 hypothetical protein H310_05157 [Aphanomyces invadans]|eukprot:XP_008868020.1 hypothetical protein H310_05157 [Aphanomyces invadans]
MTASHQALYDRMVDILGEGDTQSLLSPLSVDARLRQSLQDAQAQTLRVYQEAAVGADLQPAPTIPPYGCQASETAADALCITRESTSVAFALSHPKGHAENWAYSIRLTNSMSFATFDELVAAIKLRFLPNTAISNIAPCKTTFTTLHFLAANVNDNSTLSKALRVNVFTGLNHAELYASALEHNRADPSDMDISALSHANDDK